ncbi:alpha/beta hydrolase [Paramagnetospirillum kuznetsovii]|uniref:Alpha/beta hydrolase n=1 Tax=Paramagnetospirillum kuznetsovii TaxID=2053833 RepID=A0A364NW69_9PROT|nr:alpha/beta fold hydrolase [Paramagnetospirillum kuznetsovii]RAU21334.1 alpha/beta hydrolase [Paramagnetospirillum kuznetsovii]
MKLELLYCRPTTPPPPARPPILFVHGSYCGAWVWAEKFMPFFAKAGFACHAVSLRGHGDSEGRYDHASLDDYVSDVRRAMDHIGGRCILIGHSMGGLVAQHVMAGESDVEAAVLLSSVPPSGLASSALHMSIFSPDVCIQFALLQSMGPSAVKGEIIRKALFCDETPARDVAALLPRFQQESQRICVELLNPARPLLPKPRGAKPILVMGGDRDILVPSFALYETAAYFDADLEVLSGAPHGLMLDTLWWEPTADKTLQWLLEKGF